MPWPLTDGTLSLRPIAAEDATAFGEAVAASAPHLRRWLGTDSTPSTPQAVEAYIQLWTQATQERTGYGFIVLDSSSRCVGFGLVNGINPRHRFANVGYWIRSDAQGRGYAVALVHLLARFGFEELGLHRLELVIDPANAASRRVAEKVGAPCEGRLRNRLCIDGAVGDALMYGLLPPGAGAGGQ